MDAPLHQSRHEREEEEDLMEKLADLTEVKEAANEAEVLAEAEATPVPAALVPPV